MSKLVAFFNPNAKGSAWESPVFITAFVCFCIHAVLTLLSLIGYIIIANSETINYYELSGIGCFENTDVRRNCEENWYSWSCAFLGFELSFLLIIFNAVILTWRAIPYLVGGFVLFIAYPEMLQRYQKFNPVAEKTK